MVLKPKDFNIEWKIPLEKINKARRLTREKSVSYESFQFGIWTEILLSRINFNSHIPGPQKESMLRQVLFKDRGNKFVTTDNLYEELTKLEQKYLKLSPSKFHLYTHIQLDRTFRYKKLRVCDCIIHFDIKNIKKYNRNEVGEVIKSLKLEEPNTNFKEIVVEVSARCENEAYMRTMEALDIFRAIINITTSMGSLTYLEMNGGSKSLNHVAIGPIRTLHYANGELASKTFHYEPTFNNKIRPQDLSRHENSLRKYPYFIRKITSSSELSDEACRSLALYIRALDYRDVESVYIHLWSLLEFLTHTEKLTFEITVKRAASIFRDYNESLFILNTFRNIRNKFIHSHESENITILAMHLLKRFIEEHILNLIHNPYKVKNLEEYASVLDLLQTGADLPRRRQLLKTVIKEKDKRLLSQ